MTVQFIVPIDSISIAVRTPAPKITGMERRKEKRADFSDDIPNARPVQIVNPEREIPGIIAIACESPISNPIK